MRTLQEIMDARVGDGPLCDPENSQVHQYQVAATAPRDFGSWIVPAPEMGRAFLKINKNACTGIQAAIMHKHGVPPMPQHEYLEKYGDDLQVVAMWRDPYKRLQSCYRFIQRDDLTGVLKEGKQLPDYRLPWPDWVTALCGAEWSDPHVATQYELAFNDRVEPDAIVPWDFEYIKFLFGLEDIPIRNESPKLDCPWDPVLRDLVYRRYHEDFLIWNTASRHWRS